MDVIMLGRRLTRSIVSGIIAGYCASVFAVGARANTTWMVRVDVTSQNDVPTYSITSSPPNAKNCDSTHTADPSKGDVAICAGDSIQWTFVTGGHNGWLTIHQSDGVLKDSNGKSKYYIREQEQGLKDPGATDPHEHNNTYKYCIAIHDKNGSKTRLYTHDPKIIIGGGSPFELLKRACNDLVVSIQDSSKADQAKAICEDAENKLGNLLSRK
jgi:hypothetical protein